MKGNLRFFFLILTYVPCLLRGQIQSQELLSSQNNSPLSPGTTAQHSSPLLTRQEAERIALANNPRVKVSQLLARVQGEVVRETRSNELPNLNGNLTGVDANEASRLSSGALTSSRLLQHAGGGVQFSQLITDFGHTRNLVASAKLREKATQADAEASREDIILATDQVFFQVIEAQATLKVALETVTERQTLVDQVQALTTAKLKSDLDLSFAAVNLSQAKLLQLDAQTNVDSAKASLWTVLGYDHPLDYQLVDDAGDLADLPKNVEDSIAAALRNRPDLQSLHFSEQAEQKFSLAQREQKLPTVSALGVVGGTPWGSSQYFTTNWYGAVGLNITVPIFNGFRFSAEAAQAALQASADTERARDLRNQVVRNVRSAWLNANAARERVAVTVELLKQANTALTLAQTRYQLGLSSIVELSQAQLQQTQASIDTANARSRFEFNFAALQFETAATRATP